MLDTPITFTVRYTTATLTDPTNGGSDSVTIAKKELVTELGASRSVSQTIVNAGDIITFTFNLENLGETTLENIVIKANALASGALNNTHRLRWLRARRNRSHMITRFRPRR